MPYTQEWYLERIGLVEQSLARADEARSQDRQIDLVTQAMNDLLTAFQCLAMDVAPSHNQQQTRHMILGEKGAPPRILIAAYPECRDCGIRLTLAHADEHCCCETPVSAAEREQAQALLAVIAAYNETETAGSAA